MPKFYVRFLPLMLLCFAATLFACSQTVDSAPTTAEDEDLGRRVTFVLTRHAEKGAGQDPELTAEGNRRAQRLAARLAGEDVRAVYATNTTRTQSTAAPTAKQHNVSVTDYIPSNPKSFARQLLDEHQEGTVLIVGHSNTIPDLVNALSGSTDYGAISEEDYGNLYTVAVNRKGKIRVRQRRY